MAETSWNNGSPTVRDGTLIRLKTANRQRCESTISRESRLAWHGLSSMLAPNCLLDLAWCRGIGPRDKMSIGKAPKNLGQYVYVAHSLCSGPVAPASAGLRPVPSSPSIVDSNHEVVRTAYLIQNPQSFARSAPASRGEDVSDLAQDCRRVH